MNLPQGEAVLDVWDACIAVSYAYRQCAYHQEHLRSSLHKKCDARCKTVGENVNQRLTKAIDLLKEFYKTAFELGVEESLLDITLYDLLPGDVFNAIYEEAA